MERKSTFIAVISKPRYDRHAWEHTDLLYEYRGHQYIVTKHNNGYAFNPLWKQHQIEQDRIDNLIAHKDDPIEEQTYTGSAQEGFDLFWNYVNGDSDL